MHAVIVSSSRTQPDIPDKIRAGSHPRIDYLELACRMAADVIDFNRFEHKDLARRIENALRLDWRQAVWVAGQVRKKGYDTVLSMSERVAIPLAMLLPRWVKHVVIGHHLVSPNKLRFIKWSGLYRRWDTIIMPTEAEARALTRQLKPGLRRLERIPFPVDTEFFKPISTGIAGTQDHILSVGLSHRDYPTLVKALRRTPHVACQLRIGSSWVDGVSGIDEGQALPENVTALPFVPLPELLRAYARCRFVVIPIRRTTQWSAGSISVLLAQAMGKAVLVTCTPGMPDYVRDGETGFLVEPGSPEKMAQAIDELWSHPELTERMGKQARTWMAETFTLEKWLERTSEILAGSR